MILTDPKYFVIQSIKPIEIYGVARPSIWAGDLGELVGCLACFAFLDLTIIVTLVICNVLNQRTMAIFSKGTSFICAPNQLVTNIVLAGKPA
jgi:hypothetical protein